MSAQEAVAEDFENLLKDEGAVNLLLQIDPDEIYPETRHNLARLYEHFCDGGRDDDTKGVESDAGTGPLVPKKRRSKGALPRPRKKVATRDHPMMRLTKDVALEPEIGRYLDELETEFAPSEFFDEVLPLSRELDKFKKDEYGAKFMATCEYMVDLEKRGRLDPVRLAFQKLFIYDVVTLLFENQSGRRFSPEMRDRFAKWAEIVYKDDENMVNNMVDKVDVWSRAGLKISQLCDQFSDGCLFYLAKHLSDDFLLNKYLETGGVHDKVFDALTELGLKSVVAAAGLDVVGRQCRAHLIGAFDDLVR